jgi:prevent-host-death family protein
LHFVRRGDFGIHTHEGKGKAREPAVSVYPLTAGQLTPTPVLDYSQRTEVMNPTKPVSTVTATALQQQVGQVTRRVYKDKEHIIVERGGFPIVVIIPIDEYEQLTGKKPRRAD